MTFSERIQAARPGFGKGFVADDGIGGRIFGMGRKLGSGDLQLLILDLLAAKPRHGYEIIRALDERSQGFYVPSPGMVYPALARLSESGRTAIEPDGARKRYHLTAGGRAHLEANRRAADILSAQFARVRRRMQSVRRALDGGRTVESDGGEPAGAPAVVDARRDLDAAIAARSGEPEAEQQRIAAILKRAADEIGGRP